MKRERREQGFTLVELMVVVAIMGIMATIAYPNAAKLMRRDNVKRIARTEAERFNEYRTYAMSSGRAVVILLWSGANWYEVWAISSPTSACNPFLESGMEDLEFSYSFGKGMSVEYNAPTPAFGGGSAWLCFKPNGRMVEADFWTEFPLERPVEIYVHETGQPRDRGYLVEVPSLGTARVWGI